MSAPSGMPRPVGKSPGAGGRLLVEVTNRSAGPDGGRALKGPRLGRVRRALSAAAKLAARRFGGDARARGRAVNVVWLSDREMRRLNRRFGGLRGSADVLAGAGGWAIAEAGRPCPGEIACNLELARRSARENGNSIEAEAVLYAVHGLVHLWGGKDDTSRGRRAMREVELAALAEAGLRVRGGEWE